MFVVGGLQYADNIRNLHKYTSCNTVRLAGLITVPRQLEAGLVGSYVQPSYSSASPWQAVVEFAPDITTLRIDMHQLNQLHNREGYKFKGLSRQADTCYLYNHCKVYRWSTAAKKPT